MELQNILNLLLVLSIFFLTGLSCSLPLAFYPNFALNKGVSITLSGIVFASCFIAELSLTPIWGKNIEKIGGVKNVAIYSLCSVAGGNMVSALLHILDNTTSFVAVSFLGRMLVGIGQAGVITSGYTLASQQSSPQHTGKMVCVADTFRGLGETLGSMFGAVLFQMDGVFLPFFVSGVICLVVIGLSKVLLKEDNTNQYEEILEDNERTVSRNASYFQILSVPIIPICMLSVIFAASGCKWTSSSMQIFLMEKFGLTISETSLIIMIYSITYTVFTPAIGVLLDAGLNRDHTLFIGNILICISFIFIGPVPQLKSFGSHIWLTAASHGLNGLGAVFTYMGALIYMTECATSHLANTVQIKGMVSSIWSICYSIGGITGSVLGGLAYDMAGFQTGTGIEAALMAASVLVLGLYTGWRRLTAKNNPYDLIA